MTLSKKTQWLDMLWHLDPFYRFGGASAAALGRCRRPRRCPSRSSGLRVRPGTSFTARKSQQWSRPEKVRYFLIFLETRLNLHISILLSKCIFPYSIFAKLFSLAAAHNKESIITFTSFLERGLLEDLIV